MKFGLRPVGTIAHEWIMAVGAKEDYVTPNTKAMDAWEKGKPMLIFLASLCLLLHRSVVLVYPPSPTSPLHTMLTDTYTTKTFFEEFVADPERALRWNGLRHDSGSPMTFARNVKQTWESIADATGKKLEEVLKGKKVIFSDGLSIDGALEIWETCEALGIDGKLRQCEPRGKRGAKVSKSLSSLVWYRYKPYQRFPSCFRSNSKVQAP
jgi:nicotinate phosphoribosyltransferase